MNGRNEPQIPNAFITRLPGIGHVPELGDITRLNGGTEVLTVGEAGRGTRVRWGPAGPILGKSASPSPNRQKQRAEPEGPLGTLAFLQSGCGDRNLAQAGEWGCSVSPGYAAGNSLPPARGPPLAHLTLAES